jgi:hypothetical protein
MSAQTLSKHTQKNWLIDAALFGSAIVAILSGIYFLFVPSGGFQGGRNRFYNLQILFDRHTWDDLHTWGGIAMIAVAIIHLIIHWNWVVGMARRTWNELSGQGSGMNARGRYNLLLNATVAVSFVITAISGGYFLFVPGGRGAIDPQFLFTRTTWNLLHTWAGVVMTIAAVLHFAIHWKWVTKVTLKMVRSVNPYHPEEHSVSVVEA